MRSLGAMVAAALVTLSLCIGVSVAQAAQDGSGKETQAGEATSLENASIAEWRRYMLELAYEGASAYPIVPHIKNRSRAQEDVVRAAIELDQPRLALHYIGGIENWRRGSGYADLAYYLVEERGRTDVQWLLEKARLIADAKGLAKWRRDRIRVKIARAYARLGQDKDAVEYVGSLGNAEVGKVTQVQAKLTDDEAFDQRMREIGTLIDSQVFGKIRNALAAYGELYVRFFEDEGRRDRVMEEVEAAWKKMPGFIRLDLLIDMADGALRHGGREQALKLVGMAEEMMASGKGAHRHEIPYRVRLLKLRFRAGEEKEALARLQKVRERFEMAEEEIQDLHRARILRPIAEAYEVMGETQCSLKTYKNVVELGVINPNIRPRITDFVLTSCSMALHGVEPDAKLWKRLRNIKKGLGPK